MLVHDHKTMKSEVFDFRETAPAAATADMFGGDRSKTRSVSVNKNSMILTHFSISFLWPDSLVGSAA